MKYRLVAVFALLVSSLTLFGQRGYFVTDTSANLNMNLILGDEITNAQICTVKTGKEIKTYTPYEVKEYGYKRGRVYRAKDIVIGDSTVRVFLELLHKGTTTLYYYRDENIKTYFIEKDSTIFIEIPKNAEEGNDYSFQLLNYTSDCRKTEDACKLVAYNKNSMAKLVSRYNECALKPFPFTEYGIFFGLNNSQLLLNNAAINDVLKSFSFQPERNIYIGGFVDRPLFAGDFSLYSSVGILKTSYASNAVFDNYDADVLINQTAIMVPLMIRYTLPFNYVRPYLSLGVHNTWNIRNESTIYKAIIAGGVIQYELPDRNLIIATYQPGYAYGFGVQCNIDYKRMIFLEFRGHRDYSLGGNDVLHKNSLEIFCGISF